MDRRERYKDFGGALENGTETEQKLGERYTTFGVALPVNFEVNRSIGGSTSQRGR